MPLDPKLEKFTTVSPLLTNYSWDDVRSGVGYQTYYLIESQDSGGKDYHLTTQTDYSNTAVRTESGSTFDEDFDLSTFALAQEIEGTALFSMCLKTISAATPTVTIELYKWDGSSETIIGSASVLQRGADTVSMIYMEYDVPYTHFSKGETLRLRLEVEQTSGVAVWFGIDPANRADGNLSITTTSKIHIPYKTNT